MKLKNSKKIFSIISSILATITIYTGALVIVLYVQGWRIDLTNQSVKKVGILTVESTPTLAEIYIDGENKGRSNKSIPLDIGSHEVIVSKDGYYDWQKSVDILEEKSTPIFPILIKRNLIPTLIYQSDLLLEQYWIDDSNSNLLLLLRDDNTYRLLHYNINNSFWSLNSTPTTVLTINSTDENSISDINLQLSPSGKKAILQVFMDKSTNKYIIPTTRASSYATITESPLNLEDFNNYNISWTQDENYLILESQNDVISYDVNNKTKYVLMKKTNPLDVWSTDKDGYFYIFKNVETEDDNLLQYRLYQYNIDGTGETELISAFYLQKNLEYLETYRAENFDFDFFTNSPECTQTIGEISYFNVNEDTMGLFIQTTQSTYWYDTTLDKYITISPYPSVLLEYSPDGDKALIKTPTDYAIFTFDKEEGDHTLTIGTKNISNLDYDQIVKINWLSNSNNLQYQENETVYLTDREGDNKTPLTENENILFWIVTTSGDELIVLSQKKNQGVDITSYNLQ